MWPLAQRAGARDGFSYRHGPGVQLIKPALGAQTASQLGTIHRPRPARAPWARSSPCLVSRDEDGGTQRGSETSSPGNFARAPGQETLFRQKWRRSARLLGRFGMSPNPSTREAMRRPSRPPGSPAKSCCPHHPRSAMRQFGRWRRRPDGRMPCHRCSEIR